jgi:hypothetical protein
MVIEGGTSGTRKENREVLGVKMGESTEVFEKSEGWDEEVENEGFKGEWIEEVNDVLEIEQVGVWDGKGTLKEDQNGNIDGGGTKPTDECSQDVG